MLTVLVAVAPTSGARPEYVDSAPPPIPKDMHGAFVLDGQFVHNVGELQMNITNWGLIGSWPGSGTPMSDAPSAMWPAGSGVDYLWAAGIWVGALKGGIPLVSTGQPNWEIMANPDDPLATIYETYQGDEGGERYPEPDEDDDRDGQLDEDPLNGVDDDLDGLVDEDFAAIGNQHFRCVMRDDTSLAQELFDDHEPLEIEVVQESFQWESDVNDDFVGFRYRITNVGTRTLHDLYVGFYVDCDIGPRDGSAVGYDDLPHFVRRSVRAPDNSLVPLLIGMMYDDDGDHGLAPGFFGLVFLDHPIDNRGETAPAKVGVTTFQTFSARQTFEQGGLPNNDEERYELLSRTSIEETPDLYDWMKANDYKFVMGTGPFTPVEPREALTFQAAFVVGAGENGILRNASEAALTYYGAYFDRDHWPFTGMNGRETHLCAEDFGPISPTNPLFRLFRDCVDSAALASDNPPRPLRMQDLDEENCVWIDADCDFERSRGAENCNRETELALREDELVGCTGVAGREFHVPWLIGLPPPPPHMRLWESDNRVHIFWNSLSQMVPDHRLQQIDFESYYVWRAAGWDRPHGSSIENGPESRLWNLVAQFDEINSFEHTREIRRERITQILPLGSNTGFDLIAYTPRPLREGDPLAQRVDEARDLVGRILADPELDHLGPTTDLGRYLRFFSDSGHVTPVGLRFPELRSWEREYAILDTVFWDTTGVRFYEYVDRSVHNGIHYFYAVTASDHAVRETSSGELIPTGPGMSGDPQGNFGFAMPGSDAQTAQERDRLGHDIYVVPNPATRESLAEFSQLHPNSEDPTGVRVMFANLPAAHSTIKIFTLAGDLVQVLRHDGTGGYGSAFWNLVSRNGQRVTSGIYLYSVQTDDRAFDRVIGRFVVVE